jgi:hypothetical protein
MSAPDDVRKALDHEWRDKKDIHARVALWSLQTVRANLNAMKRAHEVEVRTVPSSVCVFDKNEYRLPPERPDGEKL